MTLKEITARVNYWRERLGPLGIAHYQMVVRWNEVPHGQKDSIAAVMCEEDYDIFALEISRSWVNEHTPREVDEVIVHELMHVVMHDVDFAVDQLEQFVPPEAWSMWESNYIHFVESMVRRLSTTITTIAR